MSTMHLNQPCHLASDLDCLRPFVVPDLSRIGSNGDGGYVVPASALNEIDALISFGLSDNWSLEDFFYSVRPGLPIHSYDHTVGSEWFAHSQRVALKRYVNGFLRRLSLRCSASELQRLRLELHVSKDICANYHTFFKGNRVHFQERVYNRKDRSTDTTIDTVFERMPDSCKIFLKMDIEGGEYRVLRDILRYADRIVMLTIEFHDTEPFRTIFVDHVRTICEHFRIVHLHANNCGGVAADGLPEVLEITFLKRDMVITDTRRSRLPIDGLDTPNDPSRPDFALSWSGT